MAKSSTKTASAPVATSAPLAKPKAPAARPDPKTLPRATHEGKVRIGDAEFDCYILPGGVRVLSQRATLRAIGAAQTGNVSLSKKPEKNRVAKPNVSDPENATNQGDFSHMGRVAKLQFLPPVGGTAINGYTLYQVIDFLRDWSGRFTRGELRENQKHIGLKATQTLIACAGLGLEAMVDDACERVCQVHSPDAAEWMRTLDRQAFIDAFNNATPAQVEAATATLSPEGQAWARAFEAKGTPR